MLRTDSLYFLSPTSMAGFYLPIYQESGLGLAVHRMVAAGAFDKFG
jgi:hypothetical protein